MGLLKLFKSIFIKNFKQIYLLLSINIFVIILLSFSIYMNKSVEFTDNLLLNLFILDIKNIFGVVIYLIHNFTLFAYISLISSISELSRVKEWSLRFISIRKAKIFVYKLSYLLIFKYCFAEIILLLMITSIFEINDINILTILYSYLCMSLILFNSMSYSYSNSKTYIPFLVLTFYSIMPNFISSNLLISIIYTIILVITVILNFNQDEKKIVKINR